MENKLQIIMSRRHAGELYRYSALGTSIQPHSILRLLPTAIRTGTVQNEKVPPACERARVERTWDVRVCSVDAKQIGAYGDSTR
jgi:hypothetical protein